MSNKVSGRRPLFEPPSGTTLNKNERRQAAKEARAKAAIVAERRRLAANVGVALLVVAVVVGAFILLRPAFTGSPSASASDNPTPTPTSASSFPQLPAGADQALATKPVVAAPTGEVTELKVTPLIEGTGAATQKGQKITVNYVGVAFKTGQEFDSSWSRSSPFDFTLGAGGVIKGWDEGLVGLKVGSRVQIDIPSGMAYGDTGDPGGPLRFVVDILSAG